MRTRGDACRGASFASVRAVVWLALLLWPASVGAITVTPAAPTILAGQTQQFTVIGAPSAVATGGWHTCLRLSDGTARCAGQNRFGQLGHGTFDNSTVPVAVGDLATTSVVAGDAHTCALLADGTVKCWGVGDSGQRGDGTFATPQPNPVSVIGLPRAVDAITAGGFHTCALFLPDGTVRCWGRNADGQLGDANAGTPCPFTPGLCSSAPVVASRVTGAAAITAGGYHTCTLLPPDGTVKCWGRNDDGQLGDGTRTTSSAPVPVVGLTGVAVVTGGGYHTCALLADGTVQCWGQNADGQLGAGITGGVSTTPVRVIGLTGPVAAVSGGWKHTCALLRDSTVECWGRNEFGQLGDGTTTSSPTPVQVVGIAGARAISAGGAHTCALLGDETVKCWGENDFGELGHGTAINSPIPLTVTGTGLLWTSSDSTVATVDPTGLATGVGPGVATITATDGSGASASTTLTVRPRVSLSVARAGPGTGTVSSSPPGISCGTDCSESYASGTTVTLTAAPATGSTFRSWSGCDTASDTTCTVTLSEARVVTATFNLQRFTLTVKPAGAGSGAVTSGDGSINCGAICSASYDFGTRASLTATPAPLNAFIGWSGGGCSGTGTCVLTLSAETTVTATFAPTVALTVAKAGAGSGTVTSSPAGIDCGATCSALYPSGTVVTLTVTPGANSVFTGWSGGGCSGRGACTLTLTATAAVTATVGVEIFFSDDPLVPQRTVVKPIHIAEVRHDVDAFRVAHGLAPFVWTDPQLEATVVKAVHLLELRSALDQAYQAAGQAPPVYTDPTVQPGVTVIKAIHLNELRSALRALE